MSSTSRVSDSKVQGRARRFTFLTSSQVSLLLIQELIFKNHCREDKVSKHSICQVAISNAEKNKAGKRWMLPCPQGPE